MSVRSRSPPSPPPQLPSGHELKQRVVSCLNKLADRDTLALAAAELEFIAKNLTQEFFSPFLSCLHNTDASSKSPVRKQCVTLLSLLCQSHGNCLSPHLSKMVSTVLRRLKDPDSAVRSACAAATAAMSSRITKPPFSVLSKPLIDALTHDQDVNVQMGVAMCLSSAVEAAPDPEVEQLRKALPKMGKLLKNGGFKAKAALLGVMGSVVSVGGAGSKGVLDWLVPCLTEFLSSEDWAARKAAAEALGRLALAEKELAPEYKKACLTTLENRRFDKVKIVRETMNHTLELWKDVPGDRDEVISSPSKSSSDNGGLGCFPPATKSSSDVGFKTPGPRKAIPIASRSPPSDSSCVTTAKKENSLETHPENSVSSRLDHKKPLDSKIKIDESQSPCLKVPSGAHTKRRDPVVVESGENGNSKPEIKRVLFSKIHDEKGHKFGGLRSGSRVVPCNDDEGSDTAVSTAAEEVDENQKDVEDLSLIHEQLAQIENQQSNLLNLLQRFIGSSQNGIHSLESRVHGLEMALGEISYDLALSTGRIPNSDHAENTCCKLPGAEFLSSKFWRKTDGRFSHPRFSSSMHMQPIHASNNMNNKDTHVETCKSNSQRFQQESRGSLIVNPLAEVCSDPRGPSGFCSNRTSKNLLHAESAQVCSPGMLDGSPSARCIASANLSTRFST